MKKWEYRVEGLSTSFFKNFNDEKSVREVKDLLSQIGSGGWELVGVMPTNQPQGQMKSCLLIFKKELD